MVVLAGNITGSLTVASKNTAGPAFSSLGTAVSDQWAMATCIGRFGSTSGSSPASVVTGYWDQTAFTQSGVPEQSSGSVTEYIQTASDLFPVSRYLDEGTH